MSKPRYLVHVMSGSGAGWFTTSNPYDTGPPGSTSMTIELPEHCAVLSLKQTSLKSDLRLPDLSTLGATLTRESPIPCLRQAVGGPSQDAYGAGSVFIFRLPRAVPENEVWLALRSDDERLFKVAVL